MLTTSTKNTTESYYMGDPNQAQQIEFCWDDYFDETDAIYSIEEDNVNHPKHYTQHPSGVECIEITQHYNFCVGNAIKYLWRAGLKTEANLDSKAKQIEDLNKAIWYISREIKNLESGVYE